MKSIGIGLRKRVSYNRVGNSSRIEKGLWWALCAAVAKRSGGACEAYASGRRCGKKAVDVHHIKPISRGGLNTLSNLIHLCSECHERRHVHLARVNYAENRAEIMSKKRGH